MIYTEIDRAKDKLWLTSRKEIHLVANILLDFVVIISFIDSQERIFVASDREFFVPFNTHIYNRSHQPIALSTLKVGNKIWLYLGNSKKGRSEIKRIETLK